MTVYTADAWLVPFTGSICIEALTLSGSEGSWRPDYCVESILHVSAFCCVLCVLGS